MIDFELEELSEDTRWRTVLQAYLEKQQAKIAQARMVAPERGALEGGEQVKIDDWIPRLAAVEGVLQEDLSKIHGKLIALGYLKFQISGREKGMCYQLSPSGKQALEQKFSAETDDQFPSQDQSEAA